jgi:hypothetical protein
LAQEIVRLRKAERADIERSPVDGFAPLQSTEVRRSLDEVDAVPFGHQFAGGHHSRYTTPNNEHSTRTIDHAHVNTVSPFC